VTRFNPYKVVSRVALWAVVLGFNTVLAAGTVKIAGLIVGRSGDEMIVQFGSGGELAFLFTDSTQVSQIGGLFKRAGKDVNGRFHSRPESSSSGHLQQ